METSVHRGTRRRLFFIYLANIVKIQNGSHPRIIALVLDRTGTLPDVHLIIRELTHVEGGVLDHQVLNVKGRSFVDGIILRNDNLPTIRVSEGGSHIQAILRKKFLKLTLLSAWSRIEQDFCFLYVSTRRRGGT